MKTIFKSENGEVWRDGDDYGTLKAGHELCRDMAKEIERLRELNARLIKVNKELETLWFYH